MAKGQQRGNREAKKPKKEKPKDAAVIGCDGWESIQPYAGVNFDDMHLVLCRYPFRTWLWVKVGQTCMAIVTAD